MSKKKFSAEQIVTKLSQIEVLLAQGKTIAVACKEVGTTDKSYYRWRNEYGGLGVDQAKKHRERIRSITAVSGNNPEAHCSLPRFHFGGWAAARFRLFPPVKLHPNRAVQLGTIGGLRA